LFAVNPNESLDTAPAELVVCHNPKSRCAVPVIMSVPEGALSNDVALELKLANRTMAASLVAVVAGKVTASEADDVCSKYVTDAKLPPLTLNTATSIDPVNIGKLKS
jgi:uncharacterized NAD-dependent epimerase/dehydratase family protein